MRDRPGFLLSGAVALQARLGRVRSHPDLGARLLGAFHRDLRSLADEDLIALVRDREPRALEMIFERHGGAAFSLAYRMCGRRALAEDVVQESFLSLWRSSGSYQRSRGGVRPWLLSVVRNRMIDAFRHEAVATCRDVRDEAAAGVPAPERTELEVERREDAKQVRDALEGLPPEQRQVIQLAYFGGFTHSEIAHMLELPSGTVKGRMRLGLTKLRIALGDPTMVTS